MPGQDRTGNRDEFLARSRVLALIVAVGAIALVALLLALPFTMEHTLEGAQLILWASILLILALIVGIALVYSYMSRYASMAISRQPLIGETVEAGRDEDLTLQLLPEDERALYRRLLHEGGEVLQKDLHSMLPFSGAKITRVLTKLEEKGLVVRERHGMTNRIRVVDRGS